MASDRAVNIFSQLALAADGAFAGVAFAYAAVQSYLSFRYTSSALEKIRRAEAVPVSDLRSLLTQSQSDDDVDGDGKLVVVRGFVEAKYNLDGSSSNLTRVLLSQNSGEEGVIWQKTQTWIYNDSKGLFGWTRDLHSIILGTKSSWRNPKATSLRTIPFVLVGGTASSSSSSYVSVDLDGSTHPLPLTTVHHQLEPLPTSPYTFFQALAGHSYPVGLLNEEKLLPLGKEISAVGICTGDPPHIKSTQHLPYFLSDMTKDQMLKDLAVRADLCFYSALFLGFVSVGILCYSVNKNWRRWKEWIQQMRLRRARTNEIANEMDATSTDIHPDEESEDVPEGQLCVICLMRRKRSAFVPCGHFVCCHRCALSVERESLPKCPLCRQAIRTSVRIYDS